MEFCLPFFLITLDEIRKKIMDDNLIKFLLPPLIIFFSDSIIATSLLQGVQGVQGVQAITEYSDFFKISIRLFRIKDLIHPHNRNHIRITQVLNIMSIAYWNINHFRLFSRNKIFIHFYIIYLTEANHTFTTYNQKLLILGMMPVLTFCNTRFRDIY